MTGNTNSSTQQDASTNQKHDGSGGQQTAINKMRVDVSTSKSANIAAASSTESHLLHKSADECVADFIAHPGS